MKLFEIIFILNISRNVINLSKYKILINLSIIYLTIKTNYIFIILLLIFFSHKIIYDINMFNTNMKLSVFYENYNFLIIIENHDNFKIRIIKTKKLIKKKFN